MLDNNLIVAEWYDIYGTRYLPFWKQPYVVWGVLLGIVGIISSALIIFLVRYRRSSRYLSPRDKALRGLHEIRTRYLHKAHTRIFYITLTQIAKQYIAEACGLDVCAKTDTEVFTMLQSKHDSIEGIKHLSYLFQHVERSKFSSDTVDLEKMKQDANLLDCFIASHHSNNQSNQKTT